MEKHLVKDIVFNYLKNKPMSHYRINDEDNSIHFYVNGKIFAILSTTHSIEQLTLRFKPHIASLLCESNKYIIPSYKYMNSYHWNTIFVKAVPDSLLLNLIDASYDLSIDKMTKRQKFKLELDLIF